MPSNYFNNYGRVSITDATATITDDAHVGQRILLNRAGGITCTLPPATGSGNRYEFIIGTVLTSGAYVIQVTGNDVMAGFAMIAQDAGDTSVMFETASDSDTITMNGTTKGGSRGSYIVCDDIAQDLWAVRLWTAGTSTEASPFSAAVT